MNGTEYNLLAFLSGMEIVGILLVMLLLFGAKKLPELARGLGKGINEFKRATRDVQDELQRAVEQEPQPPPPRSAPPPPAADSTSTPPGGSTHA
jgi:sec-independent protein translocase protein TatA